MTGRGSTASASNNIVAREDWQQSSPKVSQPFGAVTREAGGKPGQGGDISGGGTMNQTMPIVKVKDLLVALEAYIAQKEKTA